jgi:hypothetical protein
MKKILCSIPGLLMLLALAGCCANDICNCPDTGLADALQFRFNYTTHRQTSGGKFVSFNASDIDTVRIYRTSLNPDITTIDSVTIGRPLVINQGDTLIATTTQVASSNGGTRPVDKQDIIVINNATPFPPSGGTKLDSYNYRISLIRNRSGNRKPTYSYYLTNIFLDGDYEANGCCSCYRNSGKAFTLGIGNPNDTERLTVVAYDTASVKEITRLPRPK